MAGLLVVVLWQSNARGQFQIRHRPGEARVKLPARSSLLLPLSSPPVSSSASSVGAKATAFVCVAATCKSALNAATKETVVRQIHRLSQSALGRRCRMLALRRSGVRTGKRAPLAVSRRDAKGETKNTMGRAKTARQAIRSDEANV